MTWGKRAAKEHQDDHNSHFESWRRHASIARAKSSSERELAGRANNRQF
jgi:hypothetical protein